MTWIRVLKVGDGQGLPEPVSLSLITELAGVAPVRVDMDPLPIAYPDLLWWANAAEQRAAVGLMAGLEGMGAGLRSIGAGFL